MDISDIPQDILGDEAFPYNLGNFTAIFEPSRIGDLRPAFIPLIGKSVKLMYAGTNSDDCSYPGEITFMLRADSSGNSLLGWLSGWIPLSDLRIEFYRGGGNGQI